MLHCSKVSEEVVCIRSQQLSICLEHLGWLFGSLFLYQPCLDEVIPAGVCK